MGAAAAPQLPPRVLAPAASAALLLLLFLVVRSPRLRQPRSVARAGAAATPRIDFTSPSRLHGKVAKQGPAAVLTDVLAAVGGRDPVDAGDLNRTRDHLHYSRAWRERRLAGQRPAQPVRFCALAVNHRYRLVFLKSPKTGGTSVLSYFLACHDQKKGWPVNEYCLEVEDVCNATKARHLRDRWDEYFVFTFTRNPLDRAVSQYQVG